jgi:hypothetical protein
MRRWLGVGATAALVIGAVAAPVARAADDAAAQLQAFQAAFREAEVLYRQERWAEAEAALTRAQTLYTQEAAGYDARRWSVPMQQVSSETSAVAGRGSPLTGIPMDDTSRGYDTARSGAPRGTVSSVQLEAAASAVQEWMPLAEVSEYLGDVLARQERWSDAAVRYRLATRWYAQRLRMFDQVLRLAPERWAAERAALAAQAAAPYGKLLAIAEDATRGRDVRIIAVQMLAKLADLKSSVGLDPTQDLERLKERERDANLKTWLEVVLRRMARETGVVTQVAGPGDGSRQVIQRLSQ